MDALDDSSYAYGRRRSWSLKSSEDNMHRRRFSIRLSGEMSEDTKRRRGEYWRSRLGALVRCKRRVLYFCLSCVCILYIVNAFRRRFFTAEKMWPAPFQFGRGQTLVFRDEDVRSVWEWEVTAGHFPRGRKLPKQLGFSIPLQNPARPKALLLHTTRQPTSITVGAGPNRGYFNRERKHNYGYPSRPVPGSIADLDVLFNHCDYSSGKYVRDCLRVLREGAGLVNVPRRDRLEDEEYIYTEDGLFQTTTASFSLPVADSADVARSHGGFRLFGLLGTQYEARPQLPPLPQFRPQHGDCDESDPRIFHVFWNGPLTDKPYMAIISFLYTQNLGLHLDKKFDDSDPTAAVCRPQLWVWINVGSRASSAEEAETVLMKELRESAWSAPFLHPRFQDAVRFKVWDTVEQLDGVPELKHEWRKYAKDLVGTHLTRRDSPAPIGNDSKSADSAPYHEPRHILPRAPSPVAAAASLPDAGSRADYDHVSVKLSDLVRFVLCHRFGGIYLDMDTLFLRDWAELWGWRGAFAYRWSRLDRYNTAVLRLHRGSALGTLLVRTALCNGLDFHPIRVTRYVKDAFVEDLLMRVPDALFDPAWLGTEGYQRERPPQPAFDRFEDFFKTPAVDAAAPEALGFDGFFKGAFSYHYHNSWWTPFDPQRNYPDLGPVFSAGEEYQMQPVSADEHGDLSWSAVLKRTFEAYLRGERPNLYGEWLQW